MTQLRFNLIVTCTITHSVEQVVPFTPSAGVLEWVDGTVPLLEYLIGRYVVRFFCKITSFTVSYRLQRSVSFPENLFYSQYS